MVKQERKPVTSIQTVENIMLSLGASRISKYYNPFSYRDVFMFNNHYYRCGSINFPNNPCIVIEVADTIEQVNSNCMEDCDPFPYDLLYEELCDEVKYVFGLKEYPNDC